MKVLLIEDNSRLAERVSRYLGANFAVDVASTAHEGIEKALSGAHDIIILDLKLPDKNGAEVCRLLREQTVTTPILVLTGIDNPKTRVSLLDSGADDYITKPFHPGELQARLRALLRRRPNGYDRHIIAVKDLTIDVNRRYVERNGVRISLRRKEFDILEYLVSNRGRAVTRTMILDHVWDGKYDSWHNTVDVHIKYLRDKVDRPFSSPLIKTAYGIGYMVDDMT
jgi:DNA-binding response OmpR family regulator